MKSIIITIALYFVAITASIAQPYTVENGNTRHRFAQLELGVTQIFAPNAGKTQIVGSNGEINNFQYGAVNTTAFFIGATHFWGHVDLGLNIPIVKSGSGMSYGVDLQAKFYPYRIENNKLRPFIGVSMSPFGYKQNDGGEFSKTQYPIVGGLNYYKNGHQFELGVSYNYTPKFDYYISRTVVGKAEIPNFMFNFTYKYTLETTGGAERNWRNGTTKKITDELNAKGKLNAFSVAVGPSAAFNVAESLYNNDNKPFLGEHSYKLFLDFGLGYYFHKPDLHVNLAYRSNHSSISGYGVSQQAVRQSVTLEAYKFLLDYHGFIPFLGPNISYENLSVTEKDGALDPINPTFKGFKPGITFGWDIRPDRLQSWILRTNLRWTPNLGVNMPDGKQVKLDQLEFNFIQLVLYPERMFGKKLKLNN